jgi:hypothetical protein
MTVRYGGGGVVFKASLIGGGGVVVTGPLGGGGGGVDHTSDSVSYETGLDFLAPSCGARVPVRQPHGPIRIHAVWLYGDLGGVDSGTGMTSTGSSSLSMVVTTTTSSSSSSSMTSSSPSPSPGDENTSYHCATGYGHGPIPWMAQGGSR